MPTGDTSPNKPRCQAQAKKTGRGCEAFVTLSSGGKFCAWHDPQNGDEKKREWARRGYLAIRPPAVDLADLTREMTCSLRSPADCVSVLEGVAGKVERGEMAPSVAQAITGAVNSAIRAAELALDARLSKLEKLLLVGRRRR